MSFIFYLIILLTLVAVVFLFCRNRRQNKKPLLRDREPSLNFEPPAFAKADKVEEPPLKNTDANTNKNSLYDPNLIVLHLDAFSGKPYMGYELHQALLSVGLSFGEGNIFHRYADGEGGKILFSLAAATHDGSFTIEDMGSFRCNGLLLFMRLQPKRKLMPIFDLMIDTARQLIEELGGDIYDDLEQIISADVIKRLREKICTVETNNPYVADLLDNLD